LTYTVGAIVDPGHAMILVFSLPGGMVGIISRTAAHTAVDKITKHAVGPVRGQLAPTSDSVIFDDSEHAIVGPTMRPRRTGPDQPGEGPTSSTRLQLPSPDRVDLGMDRDGRPDRRRAQSMNMPLTYVVFVQSIPYRFYPVLALIFVLMVILTDRDFGPMLKAELRARREGKVIRDGARPASDFDAEILTPVEGKPRRWYNAIVPIAVMTIVTVAGMYTTGRDAVISSGDTDLGLSNIFGNGDSYLSLIWGSFLACAVALIMTLAQRLLTLQETMEAWIAGLKAMLFAFVILVLAWALGQITIDIRPPT
jgi:hypothetical protein